MCGIFGWIGKIPTKDKQKMFISLGYKAQQRGTDSTGIFYRDKNGKFQTYKFIGAFTEFAERLKKEKKLSEICDSDVLIGHTRQASVGAVSINNCHPFLIGDWVCVHNGHCSFPTSVNKFWEYIPQGETDSEAIFCDLLTKKLTKEAWTDISGSFNIVMFNYKTGDHIFSTNSLSSNLYVKDSSKFRNLKMFHSYGDALDAVPLEEAAGAFVMRHLNEECLYVKEDGTETSEKIIKTYAYSNKWNGGSYYQGKDDYGDGRRGSY